MKTSEANVQSKERIFHAAKFCFARFGYDGTSVDIIAKRAKVAKGTVYHHFKSKTNIFIDLLDIMSFKFKEKYDKITAPTFTASQKMKAALDLLSDGDIENLRFGLVSLFELSIRKNKLIKKMQKNQYYDIVQAIIEEGQNNGEFNKNIDGKEFAGLIMSIVASQVALLEINGNNYDLTRFRKTIKEFITKGLTT